MEISQKREAKDSELDKYNTSTCTDNSGNRWECSNVADNENNCIVLSEEDHKDDFKSNAGLPEVDTMEAPVHATTGTDNATNESEETSTMIDDEEGAAAQHSDDQSSEGSNQQSLTANMIAISHKRNVTEDVTFEDEKTVGDATEKAVEAKNTEMIENANTKVAGVDMGQSCATTENFADQVESFDKRNAADDDRVVSSKMSQPVGASRCTEDLTENVVNDMHCVSDDVTNLPDTELKKSRRHDKEVSPDVLKKSRRHDKEVSPDVLSDNPRRMTEPADQTKHMSDLTSEDDGKLCEADPHGMNGKYPLASGDGGTVHMIDDQGDGFDKNDQNDSNDNETKLIPGHCNNNESHSPARQATDVRKTLGCATGESRRMQDQSEANLKHQHEDATDNAHCNAATPSDAAQCTDGSNNLFEDGPTEQPEFDDIDKSSRPQLENSERGKLNNSGHSSHDDNHGPSLVLNVNSEVKCYSTASESQKPTIKTSSETAGEADEKQKDVSACFTNLTGRLSEDAQGKDSGAMDHRTMGNEHTTAKGELLGSPGKQISISKTDAEVTNHGKGLQRSLAVQYHKKDPFTTENSVASKERKNHENKECNTGNSTKDGKGRQPIHDTQNGATGGESSLNADERFPKEKLHKEKKEHSTEMNKATAEEQIDANVEYLILFSSMMRDDCTDIITALNRIMHSSGGESERRQLEQSLYRKRRQLNTNIQLLTQGDPNQPQVQTSSSAEGSMAARDPVTDRIPQDGNSQEESAKPEDSDSDSDKPKPSTRLCLDKEIEDDSDADE